MNIKFIYIYNQESDFDATNTKIQRKDYPIAQVQQL